MIGRTFPRYASPASVYNGIRINYLSILSACVHALAGDSALLLYEHRHMET